MLRFFTWKFGVALPCSNHSHELSGQRMRVTPLQLYRTVLTARDCTVRMCVCVCVLVLHATKQEAFVIRWSNESRRGISQHITVTSRFTSQPSCESRVSKHASHRARVEQPLLQPTSIIRGYRAFISPRGFPRSFKPRSSRSATPSAAPAVT